jgi:hypothetical protein
MILMACLEGCLRDHGARNERSRPFIGGSFEAGLNLGLDVLAKVKKNGPLPLLDQDGRALPIGENTCVPVLANGEPVTAE